MNEVATIGAPGSFVIEGMQGAMKLAQAMASARMVPQHLQSSPGDCLMVIEQAMRWQMSPFAVAQATAVVKGKMCFEGKLVAAAIQTSGVLEGRLNYEFTGEDDKRAVICAGLIRGEKKARTVEVKLSEARTENQWWKKTPDQMLTYHAARVWARRHTPEVMLGVYAPEEMADAQEERCETVDITPEPQRVPPPQDYAKTISGWLARATQPEQAVKVRAKWTEIVASAEEAGAPIPEDLQNHIAGMITARLDALAELHAETGEVELEHAPA
ncbi:recombinase RecT [Asaia astilbis]|uniref:recombinase RecT n=1 Tax=Asaia astilbis TaxID=610244 RepID=UPI000471DB1B|nr:recombinase RecT [Asaia astilbis]